MIWAMPGSRLGRYHCQSLEKVGYEVTREYYINDAGNQIENFARSLKPAIYSSWDKMSLFRKTATTVLT